MPADIIKQKIQELSEALQAEGLWKRQQPEWVRMYQQEGGIAIADFFDWLQFVYLPNRLYSNRPAEMDTTESYITLQAKKFGGEKIHNQTIVQLLVELDALS